MSALVHDITLTVNGEEVRESVEARKSLYFVALDADREAQRHEHAMVRDPKR